MASYRDSHTGPRRGSIYDSRYEQGAQSFYFRHFERPLLEQIFGELGTTHPGRYLDVACGTGRILEIAQPNFRETVGLDVSEDMLHEARRKVPDAHFLVCDIASAPDDIGRFDVVSLFRFVLNAEPELRTAALSFIRRVIADDGVLVLNNHLNTASLLGRALTMRNAQLKTRRHATLSDSDVQTLLSQHGFRIVASYGYWHIPPWRDRLVLPAFLALALENRLRTIPALENWAKDRIYLCKPV